MAPLISGPIPPGWAPRDISKPTKALKKEWLAQPPVPEISTLFFPTPSHKFKPPLIYYGIPFPHAELCSLVDDNRFQQLDSEEWCSFLAMEGRSLEEELASPSRDGKPKTKRSLSARRIFTHGYALRCIERDLGLPKNILRMTTGLTSRGRSDLSFYCNYHGKDAVTPEQVKNILALLGVKDQPLWYLGGTGSWTRRKAKPAESSRVRSPH